jgi:hypothetical protein
VHLPLRPLATSRARAQLGARERELLISSRELLALLRLPLRDRLQLGLGARELGVHLPQVAVHLVRLGVGVGVGVGLRERGRARG